MATSQTQGALSSWGSGGPQNSWKSPEAKCGDGQLLGADVGTLRPHRGCSNTAPLIFPGRQLQPLHSAWFAEAKFLRSDVADLERPFWGSSQTHTHTHTYTHPNTHAHVPTHVHVRAHKHVCTHGHTCTNTHAHAQTHARVHTHIQMHTWGGQREADRPLRGQWQQATPPRLQTALPHPRLGGAADVAASIM